MSINSNNESMNKSENQTKVKCPVCGTEFKIGEHERQVQNATVIGKDSGLGTLYLNVEKRGEALREAGIDTSKYFSIDLPTGGQQMMKMNEDGVAVPVGSDDPIIQAIVGKGTVPNRNLFRRWIMSQVFHGLQYKYGGFTTWLKYHRYKYQWDMIVEEMRVQSKLAGRDGENYIARNRWFNKELCIKMAEDYIRQMRDDAKSRPQHKCKGVPYVRFSNANVFLTDIEKKIVEPIQRLYYRIRGANDAHELYIAVRDFNLNMHSGNGHYRQCREWVDAYKGMGAYATMQNLLRFHNCTFPKNNEFYESYKGIDSLTLLDIAAEKYKHGEGWRLFGLMKQTIEENGINIDGKMEEWRKEKEAKNLRR